MGVKQDGMALGTHGVKYVVIVPIYAPFKLIAIVFHREPLPSGKWGIEYEAKKTHMMFSKVLLP